MRTISTSSALSGSSSQSRISARPALRWRSVEQPRCGPVAWHSTGAGPPVSRDGNQWTSSSMTRMSIRSWSVIVYCWFGSEPDRVGGYAAEL